MSDSLLKAKVWLHHHLAPLIERSWLLVWIVKALWCNFSKIQFCGTECSQSLTSAHCKYNLSASSGDGTDERVSMVWNKLTMLSCALSYKWRDIKCRGTSKRASIISDRKLDLSHARRTNDEPPHTWEHIRCKHQWYVCGTWCANDFSNLTGREIHMWEIEQRFQSVCIICGHVEQILMSIGLITKQSWAGMHIQRDKYLSIIFGT